MSPPIVSLENLPMDILLEILKSLDSFSGLHSSILASPALNNVWNQNRYGISQGIARSEIGAEAWEDACRVMRYQASHDNSKDISTTPPGTLRIGGSQAAQLVFNKRKVDQCREIFSLKIFNPIQVFTGLELMTPGNKRFDAAFYRCWWYSVKFFDQEDGEQPFNPGDSYEMKSRCLAHLSPESVVDMEELLHIFTSPLVVNATMPSYLFMPWVTKDTVSQWRFSDVLWQLRLKVEGHWRKKFGIHTSMR
ncbi:hypothetical protein Q9L58_005418 [Maublancomyces gigas]|uniref:F-box domain-containing protein n=1 Tax=Discina gigas TaxID=1032678 RepID=A0ABR3GI51_9PEZI